MDPIGKVLADFVAGVLDCVVEAVVSTTIVLVAAMTALVLVYRAVLWCCIAFGPVTPEVIAGSFSILCLAMVVAWVFSLAPTE